MPVGVVQNIRRALKRPRESDEDGDGDDPSGEKMEQDVEAGSPGAIAGSPGDASGSPVVISSGSSSHEMEMDQDSVIDLTQQ